MAKEGSTIGGLMDCLGTAISVALQYGVPIESLVKKFAHQRFEPMGMTTNRDIPFAKSLVDYIFRWLGMEFVPGYHEANAPKRPKGDPMPPPPSPTVIIETPAPAREDPERPGPIAPNGASDKNVEDPPPPGGSAPSAPGVQAAIATETKRAAALPAEAGREIALEPLRVAGVINALDRSHAALMGDAPACDVCGAITIRNGSCYKCMNCGNSMGCS